MYNARGSRFQFPPENLKTTNDYRKYMKKNKASAKKQSEFEDFIAPYARHLESQVIGNIKLILLSFHSNYFVCRVNTPSTSRKNWKTPIARNWIWSWSTLWCITFVWTKDLERYSYFYQAWQTFPRCTNFSKTTFGTPEVNCNFFLSWIWRLFFGVIYRHFRQIRYFPTAFENANCGPKAHFPKTTSRSA